MYYFKNYFYQTKMICTASGDEFQQRLLEQQIVPLTISDKLFFFHPSKI